MLNFNKNQNHGNQNHTKSIDIKYMGYNSNIKNSDLLWCTLFFRQDFNYT